MTSGWCQCKNVCLTKHNPNRTNRPTSHYRDVAGACFLECEVSSNTFLVLHTSVDQTYHSYVMHFWVIARVFLVDCAHLSPLLPFYVLGQFLSYSQLKGDNSSDWKKPARGGPGIKDAPNLFLLKLRSFGYGFPRTLKCSAEQLEVIEWLS